MVQRICACFFIEFFLASGLAIGTRGVQSYSVCVLRKFLFLFLFNSFV